MNYLQSLSNIYAEVRNCKLVADKDVSPESRLELKTILDRAVPKNEEEREFEKFIKACYNRSRRGFMDCIPYPNGKREYSVNHRAVILLTTCGIISDEFDIQNIVYLRFDIKTNEFLVLEPIPNRPTSVSKPAEYFNRGRRRNNRRPSNRPKQPVANPQLTKKLDEFVTADLQEQPAPILKKAWADMTE